MGGKTTRRAVVALSWLRWTVPRFRAWPLAAVLFLCGAAEAEEKSGQIKAKYLYGPAAGVHRVAFSGDARTVAGGYTDGSVLLWDAATGKPLHILRAHKHTVMQLAFSLDKKKLISVSWEDAVIAIGPCGEQIARPSCSIIKWWDVATGKQTAERRTENTGGIICLSADGKFAAGVSNKAVIVCDLDEGKKNVTLQGRRPTTAAAFLLDNRILATAETDEQQQTVRLWSIKTGKQVLVLHAPIGVITGLAATGDEKALQLVAGSQEGMKVWNWRKAPWLEEYSLAKKAYEYPAFSPDGKLLIAGDRIWDTGTRELVRELKDAGSGPLAISPAGKKVAIGAGRNVQVYDLPSPP